MPVEGKYKKSFGKKAIAMMSEGKSKAEVCAALGVTRKAVHKWCNPNSAQYHPEFAESIEMGELLSEAWWVDLGRRAVLGEIKCHPTFWIFNMKNRFGWRDNSYVETKNQTEAKLYDMSETERKQRLVALFKENGLEVKDGKIAANG